jgi:hypothetical protein
MRDIALLGPGGVTGEPEIIVQPAARYLALDGQGAPDAFVAYADLLRLVVKTLDVPVENPLEASWWTVDGSDMTTDRMHAWRWTEMLRLPDPVGESEVARTVSKLRGHADDGLLGLVKVIRRDRCLAVQLTHTGSLVARRALMHELRVFAMRAGYRLRGRYHEIYLSDPGWGAPDARTILRWPVGPLTAEKRTTRCGGR